VNPPIYMTHGVEYMSGGIGSDEAQLMETVSPRWPATFEFAVKDHKGSADFAAGVHVTVRDSSGTALLDNVVSGGPFMVARLEPGTYEVEARIGSQTLKQSLHVPPARPPRPSSNGRQAPTWPRPARARCSDAAAAVAGAACRRRGNLMLVNPQRPLSGRRAL
jgi:hypothetical protein